MRQFYIKSAKTFMNKLLTTEVFHEFLFVEGTVITSVSYALDGHLQKEFYEKEEWEDESVRPYDIARWEDMKNPVLAMIRGKRTPVFMKLVLQASPGWFDRVLENSLSDMQRNLVRSGMLTIRYEQGRITLVTGIAYTGFLPDKEPEKRWDGAVAAFLENNGLEFE